MNTSRQARFSEKDGENLSSVDNELQMIVDAHNNHDSGLVNWRQVKTLNATTVPFVADNSSGTNDIAQFKDNSTTVLTVADGGTVTFAPAGTTKVVANSSGLTLSNSATIAMGSAKITGLAAATANGDAVRFEQLFYGAQAAAQTVATSTSSTTSSTYQNTNLSRTFTPTSSSKRVKITVMTTALSASTATSAQVSLFRDSTDLDATGNGMSIWNSFSANKVAPMSLCYIDSPATTSQITYMLKLKSTDNTNSVSVIGGMTSTIICEEIS